MDQTDAAMTAGYILGLAPGAILLKKLTGWSGWIAYPLGAVMGMFVVVLTVYLMTSLLSSVMERNVKGDKNDAEQGNSD